MTRYMMRMLVSLAAMLGAAVTLLSWIVLALCRVPRPFVWAVLVGAVLAAVAYLWMYLRMVFEDRQYKKIEGELGATPSFSSAVRVAVESTARNGRVYLTGDRLQIVFLDREPHTHIAFSPASVSGVTLTTAVCLAIEQGGHTFELMLVEADRLADEMSACGWRIVRQDGRGP